MSNPSKNARKAQDALAGTAALFMTKAPPAAAPANVVQLTPESERASEASQSLPEAIKPERVGDGPKPRKTTVAATAKRVSLYLPPKAKRKFEEIAFHDRRKEHDVFLDALRQYLEGLGHKGFL